MVFGGAALALHGLVTDRVQDIDVIVSDSAIELLRASFSWVNHADHQSDRFRSNVVFRPDFGPMPVELLGGFSIKSNEEWVEIDYTPAITVNVGSQSVLVADRKHLAKIFRLCGREKDILRARIIDNCLRHQSGEQ